ncbi:MAG: preprotein translocase subunit YajC [Elusimicrobiaceae bacterium]|nr:preprotein translocase subunit YajC [Elusimicrobiaceae bacterium]
MQTAAQGGIPVIWWIFLALMMVMIWLPARRQKKQEQERMTKVNALQKGDTVVLASGIVGTVSGFKDDAIEVKLAENMKLTVLKTAIVGFGSEKLTAQNEGGAK